MRLWNYYKGQGIMSLECYEVNKHAICPFLCIAFINFFLMLLAFVMATTVFATPSGIVIKAPTSLTAANLWGQQLEIVITSENVIYVDGKVMTLSELRRFLAHGDFSLRPFMIKADRRASMGRLADILDLCRNIPGALVNVSTIL